MKYSITHNKPELQDSDIEKYQDFESLLSEYKAATKKNRTRRLILYVLGAILILFTIGGIYYFSDSEQLSNIKTTTKQLNDEPITEKKSTPNMDSVSVETNKTPVIGNENISAETVSETDKDKSRGNVGKKSKTEDDSSNEEKQLSTEQYEYVDAYPIIGFDSLYQYFESQIVVHDSLLGTVHIQFVVKKSGLIDQINIVKSVSHFADSVANRLVQQMPPWEPATVNQEPVNSKLTIPITFEPIEK